MDWKGSIITGSEGSLFVMNLCQQNDQADKLSCRRVHQLNSESYQPWMSNLKYRTDMTALAKLRKRSEFILASDDLTLLSETISLGERDLGRIMSAPSYPGGVLLPTDKGFTTEYSMLSKALSTLQATDQVYFYRISKLIDQIIIQTSTDPTFNLRHQGSGLSSVEYRKGIFLSIPKCRFWEFELLLNLAHEAGHQSLINLQRHDRIINGDHEDPTHSVVRKTARPAILSFHALTATASMLEFLLRNYALMQKLSDDQYVRVQLSELAIDLKEGIQIFRDCELSDLGRKIIREFLALSFTVDLFNGEF